VEPQDDPVARMPVAELFGLRFLERGPGRARVALLPKREFLQGEGRIHGGVLATLADTAAVYLLHASLEPSREMTSIEFKLNFTRPALHERGELVATATVVRRGRTIALAEVEVAQGGELVAKGSFTYLLRDR
jgi:uncharacterized protein (TIGR00369 family)